MSNFFTTNQQKIAIGTGYTLVFLLAFGLGKISTSIPNPPEIVIEEPSFSNSNSDVQGIQTTTVNTPETQAPQATSLVPEDGQCGGKIKGNIGSSGKIYHVPGGSFYERTDAEECFDTEAQAVAAGYRKSSR